MSEQVSMNIMDRLRSTKAFAIVAAGVATVALAACGGKDKDPTNSMESLAAEVSCAQIDEFKDFSSNSSDYNEQAFLPESDNGIDSEDEAKDYTRNLYGGEDGPFGEETDETSLAAMYAMVTKPANDNKPKSPGYDYVGSFESALAAYRADGGTERAQDDCAETAQTLTQVAGFEENGLKKGDRVAQIVATRNSDNEITGMRLVKKTVDEDTDVVKLEQPTANNNLSGFNTVSIDEDGNTYVEGVTVDNNSRGDDRKKKGDKSQKKDRKHEGDNKAQAQDGGGADQDRESNDGSGTGPTGSNGGGGSGQGNGKGGGKGGNEGGGCGGSCGTGGNGGSGGGGGNGGGCSKCGSGGGGGNGGSGGGDGGGSTPPPVTEQPPVTPPPVTEEPPVTPPPTTPTPPPTKPPITCDPNIDDC